MTKREYDDLIAEWKSSDSVKLRNEIEDKIFRAAVKLLVELNHLYARYGRRFVEYDDYDDGRGGLNLRMEHTDKGRISLEYADSWQCGGHCDIIIDIPAKYLDEEKVKTLEECLKGERILFLKEEIEKMKKDICDIQAHICKKREELELLEGREE